jgi:hypothetical protein
MLGDTNVGPLPFTYQAGAGARSEKKTRCPSGEKLKQVIYSKRWTQGLGPFSGIRHRELKIYMDHFWSHGNINGQVYASASGGSVRAGFLVDKVSHQFTDEIQLECECKKKLPCIVLVIHVWDVYDQPWPRENSINLTPVNVKACADGTFKTW